MSILVTRSGKGAPLTHAELDTNFTNLNTDKVEDITTKASLEPSVSIDFANSKTLDSKVTFNRASTATYYDGVTLAKAEENLVLQSQALSAIGWTAYNGYVGTLGSELISNGTFDSDITGWIYSGSGSGLFEWDNGSLKLTTVTDWQNRSGVTFPVSTTIGNAYLLQVSVIATTGDNALGFKAGINNGTGENVNSGLTGVTSASQSFVATATNTKISLLASYNAGTSNWDNISLKQITLDNIFAPDGTSTAATATALRNNAAFVQSVNLTDGPYTFSVWLRRKTGSGNIDITCHSEGTWLTVSVTSSWARYTVTQTLTAGFRVPGIRIAAAGDQVEVWGAQFEQRSNATNYIETTTVQKANYIPKLLIAPVNAPRFGHDPITGESLGLIIEDQRTNYQAINDFSETPIWDMISGASKSTVNDVINPFGSFGGVGRLVASAGNSSHGYSIGSYNTLNIDKTLTFSIYVKKGNHRYISMRNASSDDGGYRIMAFDFDTETTISGKVEKIGNGWYRLSAQSIYRGANDYGIYRFTINLESSLSTLSSWNATGFEFVYLWGPQVEIGNNVTSYIPTAGSQVTRSADDVEIIPINSWFNPTSGSFLFSGRPIEDGPPAYSVLLAAAKGNSINTTIGFSASSTGGQLYASAGSSYVVMGSMPSTSTDVKLALSYSSTSLSACRNGGAVSNTAISNFPANFDRLFIGNAVGASGLPASINGSVARIAYYPKNLTNSELQSITTT